jgi:hypothetical protein
MLLIFSGEYGFLESVISRDIARRFLISSKIAFIKTCKQKKKHRK